MTISTDQNIQALYVELVKFNANVRLDKDSKLFVDELEIPVTVTQRENKKAIYETGNCKRTTSVKSALKSSPNQLGI